MKFADITADLPADALAAAKEFAIHVIGLPVSHKAYLIGPYVVDKRIRKERGLAVAFYTLLADLMECEFITVDTRSDSDMISKMLTGAAVGGGVAGVVGCGYEVARPPHKRGHFGGGYLQSGLGAGGVFEHVGQAPRLALELIERAGAG